MNSGAVLSLAVVLMMCALSVVCTYRYPYQYNNYRPAYYPQSSYSSYYQQNYYPHGYNHQYPRRQYNNYYYKMGALYYPIYHQDPYGYYFWKHGQKEYYTGHLSYSQGHYYNPNNWYSSYADYYNQCYR